MGDVRYEKVVALAGNACREVFFIHDWHGIHQALVYLAAWHVPGQHVLLSEPRIRRCDDSFEEAGYRVVLNRHRQYATLWYRLPDSGTD